MDSPSSDANRRPLLDWLAKDYPDTPRKRLKEWFQAGRVLLDDVPVRQFHTQVEDPGTRLRLGSGKPSEEKSGPQRIHTGVAIVYSDTHLVVIDKAAGLLSVPAPGRSNTSALEVLDLYMRHEGRPPGRGVLPVHRLDQYTSGLLCFARTREARSELIAQLRQQGLMREYLAFVDGVPKEAEGEWRHSLKLGKTGFTQYLVAEEEGAEEAVTHYRVEQVYEGPFGRFSRLRLQLETGLKHQIRIQAAEEGHPLLGDRLYHPGYKKVESTGSRLPPLERQALHAARLGILHPQTGKQMAWEAELPEDLRKLEALLSR